ncbi:hypothetical protein N8878_06095 [Psychromonas sp.]|nr:hypothetical protein [Psychromonas sp.]
MTITECNKQLRVLTNAHESYQLSILEYRQKRKKILDLLDKNFNGTEAEIEQINETDHQPTQLEQTIAVDDTDKTQPYFSAKLGQCINFLKGKNER